MLQRLSHTSGQDSLRQDSLNEVSLKNDSLKRNSLLTKTCGRAADSPSFVRPRNTLQGPEVLSEGSRRLGALEEAMVLLDRKCGTGRIVRVLHCVGQLDLSAFRQALADVLLCYPILRGRLGGANGTELEVVSPTISVPVGVVRCEERLAWMGAFEDNLNAPAFGSNGPLLRVEILRHPKSSRFEIVLAIHHALVDGASINQVAKTLVAAYDRRLSGREPASIRQPVSPSAETYLPPLGGAEEDAIVAQLVERQTASLSSTPTSSQTQSAMSRVLSWDIEVSDTRAAVEEWKRRGSSTQGVLGAALLSSVAKVLTDSTSSVSLATTVDLRRVHPDRIPSGVIANLSTGVRTFHRRVGSDACHWPCALEITHAVRGAIMRREPEAAIRLQRAVAEYYSVSRQPPATTTLSNLGATRFGGGYEHVRVGSVHGGVPMHCFGRTTYNQVSFSDSAIHWNLVFPWPVVTCREAEAMQEGITTSIAGFTR